MNIRVRKGHNKSEASLIYENIKNLNEKSHPRLINDTRLIEKSSTLPVTDEQLKGKFNNLIWYIQRTMQVPKSKPNRTTTHPFAHSLQRKPFDYSFQQDRLLMPTSYLHTTKKRNQSEFSHKQLRLRQLSRIGKKIFQQETEMNLPVLSGLYIGRKDIMSRSAEREDNPEVDRKKVRKIRRRANKIIDKFNRFKPDKLDDGSSNNTTKKKEKLKEELSYLALVSAADF